mmetsp:Transcript_22212/g.33270  ORF Transcript_22212/g.33270 Transcript_22212/m.33270 type:complete len:154 (+) Transcript_22212:196-657(+)
MKYCIATMPKISKGIIGLVIPQCRSGTARFHIFSASAASAAKRCTRSSSVSFLALFPVLSLPSAALGASLVAGPADAVADEEVAEDDEDEDEDDELHRDWMEIVEEDDDGEKVEIEGQGAVHMAQAPRLGWSARLRRATDAIEDCMMLELPVL